MKIYIVMGESGDFEDHREWIVTGLLTEDSAKKRAVNAEEAVKAAKNPLRHWLFPSNFENPYDKVIGTGDNYWVVPVEIEDE